MLDLANPTEREAHDFIRRMHTGRWPLLRSHGMKRIGGTLYEASEWVPRSRDGKPKFSLTEWDLSRVGVRWRMLPTLNAARQALKALTPQAQSVPCGAP